jgi:hypothetical protein
MKTVLEFENEQYPLFGSDTRREAVGKVKGLPCDSTDRDPGAGKPRAR